MSTLAANIRRLMARQGLTRDELAQRARLDRRTLGLALSAKSGRPHARTLNKLAIGLGVSVDELFRPCADLDRVEFDRATNPAVDEVLAEQPRLCATWDAADFAELYGHFGAGGALTRAGALQAILAINRKRELQGKVAILLETHEAELLTVFVELLYRRVTLAPAPRPPAAVRPSAVDSPPPGNTRRTAPANPAIRDTGTPPAPPSTDTAPGTSRTTDGSARSRPAIRSRDPVPAG